MLIQNYQNMRFVCLLRWTKKITLDNIGKSLTRLWGNAILLKSQLWDRIHALSDLLKHLSAFCWSFLCFLSHELWIFIILMKKMYFLYEEFLFMCELQYLFYLKSAVSFSKVIIVQINFHITVPSKRTVELITRLRWEIKVTVKGLVMIHCQ